ncbi:DUF4833 domain-containing protein [Flectobacillus roseus]|uniref:DUF4833 domain-containing protein n=1 Tax=Flectobacillus roseus TaxID=502259 RepID=A0ABT6YH21_9BACT|nr:DUF4833 domain-containing protein [Flectobacillus roseus]MDI9862393.1 DUF4833 domain-containing protein [Flectobacillus roseus]
MKQSRLLWLLGSLLLLSFSPAHYPKVPDSKVRLFYIQRSSNINTIVYDAKLNTKGGFDEDNPIDVYWLRYQEDGRRKELSWIQRVLAYGVDTETIEGQTDALQAWVVSYKKRKLRLGFDKNKKPYASLLINNQLAKLDHVYVQIEGSNLRPKVLYVEVFGRDFYSGENVYEKIKP